MSTIHFYIILFSTHILTRRMTERALYNFQPSGFSTHILTRRMTNSNIATRFVKTFQLTSSQGGWHRCYRRNANSKKFSTHILTRRMTSSHAYRFILLSFQLTSSQGGWHHKHLQFGIIFFSTHILTRRMTPWIWQVWSPDQFSTHILTRRMTKLFSSYVLLF